MKPDMSLHEACYQGRLEVVRELLAQGADPNGPAAAGERVWISCAGSRPKPLNCVAIAREVTENHLHIARLLIEHGATVDDSVLQDFVIESADPPDDCPLYRILKAASLRGSSG